MPLFPMLAGMPQHASGVVRGAPRHSYPITRHHHRSYRVHQEALARHYSVAWHTSGTQ
jgi:hypothetical protein